MAKTTETKTAKPKAASPKGKAKAKPTTRSGDAANTKPAGPPRQPGVERRHNHPTRAKLGFVELIMTQSVSKVGQAGDLVKVKPGYARNYLVPQGFATFATQNNLRMVEKHRQRQRELEEARRADLLNLCAQIAQRSLTIEANANAEGHLYGSVNADQIAEVLKKLSFPIDAENIRLEGPLKELGLYTIRFVLAPEIEGDVKLWVVPTHTDETTP